jgi:putative hydrolase of HD superfamily
MLSLKEGLADFVTSLSELKTIPRSGWISHHIALSDIESVAEHTYSTCALAMVLADIEKTRGRRVNMERVLRLALLHDLTETLTFDISKSYLSYLGPKGEALKKDIEHAAWLHIVGQLHATSFRTTYSKLLEEFNGQVTLESRIVRAADKLDILFQIISYHRKGYPRKMLSDLWACTRRELSLVKLASTRELQKMAVRQYRVVLSSR